MNICLVFMCALRLWTVGFLTFLFLHRHSLWILGNSRTLTNSNSIWSELICDAQERGCFFTADEDSDISKTILDVKKELDQLEDLLNGDSLLFNRQRWKVILICWFFHCCKVNSFLWQISEDWHKCPSRQVRRLWLIW